MDTSYVAVGTVIYMITDSLTCRPQEKPRRSGASYMVKASDCSRDGTTGHAPVQDGGRLCRTFRLLCHQRMGVEIAAHVSFAA